MRASQILGFEGWRFPRFKFYGFFRVLRVLTVLTVLRFEGEGLQVLGFQVFRVSWCLCLGFRVTGKLWQCVEL